MINLVVKGNRWQAAKAAAARGIPFAFRNETDHETVGVTNDEFWPDVVDWFMDDDGKAPYHNGALLLYRDG